ncbi:MAG: hypothetical protein LBE33_03525 [Zoogloeaceae bacterium]|jgi:toxin CptA|nr:hypothetical protein [Zoogloeaceae bacterium]
MIFPHRLALRSSALLGAILSLLHLAALGGLWPLPIPVWIKLALAAAVVISLVLAVRRHALRSDSASVRELVLKNDGTVEGLRNDGVRFEAGISAQTAILSWLIVILLDVPGTRRPRPLVILPDALSAEDGRCLRAWLRWKFSQGSQEIS